jgi:hypothetical protein
MTIEGVAIETALLRRKNEFFLERLQVALPNLQPVLHVELRVALAIGEVAVDRLGGDAVGNGGEGIPATIALLYI